MRSLLLALVLALIPGSAGAATVSVRVYEPPGDSRYDSAIAVAEYRAAPGEANDVRIVREYPKLRFSDVVPLQAGDGCRALSEREAECDATTSSSITLGDADDRARCDRCHVDAGPGADVVEALPGGGITARGGEGDDILRGDRGSDRLDGGYGADVLEGGEADDHLTGDESRPPFSPDRIEGGGGDLDRVIYGGRRTSVHVTLGAGGGALGEGDVIAGVERLVGSEASDVLVGDEGHNHIDGSIFASRAGDRIVGGGGHDSLSGTDGHDVLDGGPGNDSLEGNGGADRYLAGDGDDHLLVTSGYSVRRRAQAQLGCGAGRDVVSRPSPRDRIALECETVKVADVLLRRLPGALAFRARPAANLYPCPARLIARGRGRSLSRRFRIDRTATLRFAGFAGAQMVLMLRPCIDDGKPRRERLAGGFRAPR